MISVEFPQGPNTGAGINQRVSGTENSLRLRLCLPFLLNIKFFISPLQWKRRYFILFKTNEHDYQFKYFRSAEDKGTPRGAIDLTQISLLYESPQHHQKWPWVQKTFKCSPSCVLYIRAGNRDYFLIGDTSTEVERWFKALYDALNNRPHRLLSSEEISNGQPTVDIITNPLLHQRKKSNTDVDRVPFIVKKEDNSKKDKNNLTVETSQKMRSLSDPSSNAAEGNTELDADYRWSFPSDSVDSIYDIPSDREVEMVTNGTLMRSICAVYEKFIAQRSSLLISEDALSEDGQEDSRVCDDRFDLPVQTSIHQCPTETKLFLPLKITLCHYLVLVCCCLLQDDKNQSSDFSNSSSSASSPVDTPDLNGLEKQDLSESPECRTQENIEFMVKHSDLKNYLTLTESEGKPSVSDWAGQPQSVCLFHKGDQVLAINDLHTSSVEDFNMFVSKSLKKEVKVTVRRLQGSKPL
ncbi:pleckstrin homology domain-containing family S member 1-like [Cyprinodon tularosa]|uniref:pleckstrin homology domain-containing family S member 1-like n=1 Tax=Cyprinodon tularosa TaxID=77115 RepID=UPI0018E22D7E|nr:pleckstrin homology domain-containing family S member 1-like [Cyprinodon tularosa]